MLLSNKRMNANIEQQEQEQLWQRQLGEPQEQEWLLQRMNANTSNTEETLLHPNPENNAPANTPSPDNQEVEVEEQEPELRQERQGRLQELQQLRAAAEFLYFVYPNTGIGPNERKLK
ncbi:xyloglucanase 113 [Prunus dulcis]|uniref:Xyloglucanase 113 n=1 Tax=Prunus dulcis TaxID=3755 RepID=A0A5H2XUN2_PRUDU|nr:xyloglucanase 113 [Prunus dulcis]